MFICFIDLPKVKKFQFEENVQEGDTVSVICLAVSQSKPLSFRWYKNTEEIDERLKNVRIENSGDYSVLILDDVKLESSGNYTCSAQNPSGIAKQAATLLVKGKKFLSLIIFLIANSYFFIMLIIWSFI